MADDANVVAVTTCALRLVLAAAAAVLPQARVIAGPPRSAAPYDPASVGLYLFRVNLVPVTDLVAPPRRLPDDTEPDARTIELDYLVTFSGDDDRCEPELLLESAVDRLAATPVLDLAAGTVLLRSLMPGAEISEVIPSSRVVVAPLALSTEERSGLWSMLATPYQLSVEYRARVAPA